MRIQVGSALALGLIVGTGAAAYAVNTDSSFWKDSKSRSTDWQNRSVVQANTAEDPKANTQLRTKNASTNVPAGWMGARPELYVAIQFPGNGVLCATGNWYFNSSAAAQISSWVREDCGRNWSYIYAAMGLTRTIKADNTYQEIQTYITPWVND